MKIGRQAANEGGALAIQNASAGVPSLPGLVSQMRSAMRGEILAENADCAPGEVISRTLAAFSAKLPPDVGLVQNIFPNLRRVLGAGAANRVLYNLLDNALDAIQESARAGGIITVTAHTVQIRAATSIHQKGAPPQPGRYVLLAAKDNGVGMTPRVEARFLFSNLNFHHQRRPRNRVWPASIQSLLLNAGGGSPELRRATEPSGTFTYR